MENKKSSPEDIERYPANTAQEDLPNSYRSSEFNRLQSKAKLIEEVDAGSNYGSFKSNSEFLLSSSPRADYNPLQNKVEQEVSKVVKRHLVSFADQGQGTESSASSMNNREDNEDNNSNIDLEDEVIADSHNLQSGDMTRNIYKWQESVERKSRMKRSNSMPYVRENLDEEGNPLPTPSGILIPGGFRRHHILSLAERQGRTTNIITSNFLDFLALYGHFGGDVYPLDDYEESILDEEEIGERTPLARRLSHREINPPPATGSTGKAVFLLVKSFVGTGVLFLPRSFYDGGMLFSLFSLIFISFFGLHTMLLLVETQAIVGGSFGDMGQILFGEWARILILISIVVSQFGFSCTYVIFIAKNLEDVFYGLTNCEYILPTYFFVLVQLLIYIPVAMLRKIKSLSLMALIADVFIIFGLVYLVYFNINHISEKGFAHTENFNPSNFAIFIGTAIFTFEGIGLIVPIVQSMKEPEKFPAILSWTMVGITIVFVFIGSLSYATFGDKVQTVVLSNLPRGEVSSQAIQSMYAMAIILSVPLQVFPIIGILEQTLFSKSGRGSLLVKWQKNSLRISIVLAIGLISWLGASSLNHFVSLVGSFCCIPLSFIFPAAFHLKAVSSSRLVQFKNVMIVIVGLTMMCYVTYQTLANWNESSGDSTPICPPKV